MQPVNSGLLSRNEKLTGSTHFVFVSSHLLVRSVGEMQGWSNKYNLYHNEGRRFGVIRERLRRLLVLVIRHRSSA
ncbi:unnamed protein product [Auanema sp. JU1783]|nr:unnamed protein product [Auanema sp. JU1783]